MARPAPDEWLRSPATNASPVSGKDWSLSVPGGDVGGLRMVRENLQRPIGHLGVSRKVVGFHSRG